MGQTHKQHAQFATYYYRVAVMTESTAYTYTSKIRRRQVSYLLEGSLDEGSRVGLPGLYPYVDNV